MSKKTARIEKTRRLRRAANDPRMIDVPNKTGRFFNRIDYGAGVTRTKLGHESTLPSDNVE